MQKLNLKNLQIVKISTNYFTVLCPFHAEKKPSLQIHRTDDRAGQWKCFGCGAWGTLTNSEMQKLGCNKTKQIKRKSTEEYQEILLFYQNKCKYFPEILYAFSTKWNVKIDTLLSAGAGIKEQSLMFPMRSATGQIVGLQRRFLDDAKRNIAGSELGLFYDWPIKQQPQLFITEGLSDYLTLSDWGFWSAGIASAATNSQKIMDFYLTYRPESVIIVSDNDNAGLKLSYDLQHKLDEYVSTSLVIPPKLYKDLRCWKQEGKLTKEQFKKLVKI